MDRQAALRRFRLVLLAAWAAGTLAAAAAEPGRNAELHALFEREFMNSVEEAPELGTYLGLDGYDARVTGCGGASYDDAVHARRKWTRPRIRGPGASHTCARGDLNPHALSDTAT